MLLSPRHLTFPSQMRTLAYWGDRVQAHRSGLSSHIFASLNFFLLVFFFLKIFFPVLNAASVPAA